MSIAVRGTIFSVDVDSDRGLIYLDDGNAMRRPIAELTVPQSAQLRALLERAEQVVSTGIGDMVPRA
jgi:hypothetical protein